jgi:hypothetical protein
MLRPAKEGANRRCTCPTGALAGQERVAPPAGTDSA